MSVNVAVVGATGAVGDLMRKVLAERAFPIKSIKFLASEKSAGKTVEFAGKPHKVELLRPEAFAGVQIVLSSTPGSVSKEFSPIAAKAGAIVVDNSSAWRMDPDCPLVVPEVNAEQLHHIKKGIVANPNCVAIPLCVALKPLHDLAKVKRVVVATYQSSSGKGAKGLIDFERASQGVGCGPAGPGPNGARRSWRAMSSPSTGRSTRTALARKRTRLSTRPRRSSAIRRSASARPASACR